MADAQDEGRGEWRASWHVVLASALGMALSTTHVYSTGIFIAPLERAYGWGRAEITAGLTIVSVIGVLTAPFVGLAVDRFGPRRIGIASVAGFCVAMALLSLAGPSIWSWWALWLLLAIPATGIKPTIWTAAVSSLFRRHRGLALSLMLCGTGIGSSMTPILCNWLIREHGWRAAYLGLAGATALLVLPVVVLFLSSARDRSRRGGASGAAIPVAPLTGYTVREGIGSARFLKLAAGAFLISTVAVSFVVNLVPILTAAGVTRDRAAALAGLAGAASVVGRLAAGAMLDRGNGNRIAAVSVTLPIPAALLILAAPGEPAASLAAAIVLGLCLGSELDAVAYLATRHLGMRSFGVLFGTISGLLALSTGLGSLLVSYVYDRTGSYVPVLWAYLPACVLASLLFGTLGPYPDHDRATAAA
ncbi:MAG: MFS transporter [Oxalobacteraceae bacterium]|nr:MAG: MFS transporter [Oxalobacteraceae bacterium]